MLSEEDYFSGQYCQCTPCESRAVALITDGVTGCPACQACADRLAPKGWTFVAFVYDKCDDVAMMTEWRTPAARA